MKNVLMTIAALLLLENSSNAQCNYTLFPGYIQITSDQYLIAENTFYWICEGVTLDVDSSEAGTFFLEENATINFLGASLGCDAVYAKDGCTITNSSPGCVAITANPVTVTVTNTGTGSASVGFSCDSITYDYVNVGGLPCVGTSTGVSEQPSSGINIYPNPTLGKLTVEVDLPEIQNVQITITNIAGQRIYFKTFPASNAAFKKVLDLNGHSKGIYHLRITSEKGVINEQVIYQ